MPWPKNTSHYITWGLVRDNLNVLLKPDFSMMSHFLQYFLFKFKNMTVLYRFKQFFIILWRSWPLDHIALGKEMLILVGFIWLNKRSLNW